MRAVHLVRRRGRRALAAGAAALLVGVFQGAPAARQACAPQSVTRLGGNTTSFADSRNGSLSADGRYVAFESTASDLDGDSTRDIFVYDRQSCVLELVSVNSLGVKGNGSSERPSISDSGRFVVFTSFASNLIPTDANSGVDVFLHDRLLRQTVLVSVDSSEVQPTTGSASHARVSGNGQVVAFVSSSTTLVPGDTNNEADAFVRDLAAGTTERVSISTSGQQGDSPSSTGVSDPVLSEDGRYVAFLSSMNTLVQGDFNNTSDIFVRDRASSTTVRASLNANGVESTSSVSGPSITADGRFVFFAALDNFVPANTACDGIFVRDLLLGTTTCPALDPLNAAGGQNGRRPSVSSDGRYVAFTSSAAHYVPGDTGFSTDLFVHDRTSGATHRANVNASGAQANASASEPLDMSADGLVVTFESSASNLVPLDGNQSTDVFAAVWGELPSAPEVDYMRNGSFGNGMQQWQAFATPDMSYIVTDTSSGELQFYRQPPPAGTTNQAVVFQQTWTRVLAHAPLEARFRLGNSSGVRKRISVLVHDGDFSDLTVCTFWLAAGAPMRDYVMRTHTTEFWTNATIAFYAATAGSDGGSYRVDNVSLTYRPILDDDATDCIDPTAPAAPGGSPGPTLLTNGDFSGGLAPWTTFGQITWQIANSVFEFYRPAGTPAGVVFQPTGQALAPNDILTALVYLGNSSTVRKRVTVILHDSDFSDLAACTFWLPPQLPLSPYFLRTFATQAWTNASLSVYPSTVGTDEWIRFTDAVLQVTPGTTPLGTECLEPGANSALLADRGLQPVVERTRAHRRSGGRNPLSTGSLDEAILTAHRTTRGASIIWHRVLDLGGMSSPTLSFESSFEGSHSTGVVQVSLNGVDWSTIATLLPPSEWTTIDLDLALFAADILHVRLVFEGTERPMASPADRWRIRAIRLGDGR